MSISSALPRDSGGVLKKILSLLSDSAVYGISSLLSQLIGFLLLPLYTRYLTPTDQGVIAMVATVTAFYTPLSRLGMVNSIFRRFNLDKSPTARGEMLSTALASVALSSLVFLAVSAALAGTLSWLAVGNVSAVGIVELSVLAAAATSIGTVPLAVLRADRRVKTTALVNVLKLLVSVSSTIWMVVGLEWGVWGVVAGSLIGETVGMVQLFWLTASNFRYRPNLELWRRLSFYGLPFVPHQLLGLATTLVGQYMVGNLLGLTEAGLYSTATKFALPVAFAINSVQAAWVAFKFQIHAEDDDPATFFRTVTTYYVAGIMYLWVGVSVWGPEALWLLTEPSYHPAAALVAVTAMIPVAQGIYYMLGTGMEIGEDVRSMPLISLAGLITALVSVWLLVKPFGAAGAAIASANAFVAVTIVIYFLSQRRFKIHYDWLALSLLTILGAVAVGTAYLSLSWPPAPRLILAVMLSLGFPFLEFAVLLRSSTERSRMRHLWRLATRRLRRNGPPIEDAAHAGSL